MSNAPENAVQEAPQGVGSGFGGGGFQPFGSSPQQARTGASQGPPPPAAAAAEDKTAWGGGTANRAAPLPKRPKGRFFIATVLLSVLAVAAYLVWTSSLEYQAYGTIQGRVVSVSAPWVGVVRTVHVREGDLVDQGQLLMTLENVDLQQRLEEIADERRLAQATLEAEMALLMWQLEARNDRSRKAVAEYYEMWGELLQQAAKLAELNQTLLRTAAVAEHKAITQSELDEIRFATKGQQAKVSKLKVALAEMKQRVGQDHQEVTVVPDQLKPHLIRIETLQSEMLRIRDRILLGRVRAPVNGRVVRTHRYTGEYAEASQPLVEILEDASVNAVIYVPQDRVDQHRVGNDVILSIEPYDESMAFTVVRVGDLFEYAPENIKRYYRANEKLLPIYARHTANGYNDVTLWLGSEVKVRRSWTQLLSR